MWIRAELGIQGSRGGVVLAVGEIRALASPHPSLYSKHMGEEKRLGREGVELSVIGALDERAGRTYSALILVSSSVFFFASSALASSSFLIRSSCRPDLRVSSEVDAWRVLTLWPSCSSMWDSWYARAMLVVGFGEAWVGGCVVGVVVVHWIYGGRR